MTAINMAQYMRERRQKRREQLIEYLGGECSMCGITEALEIDHIDRAQKLFTLSGRSLDTKWETILQEAGKCQLLCKQHHLEKSQNNKDFGQVEHGQGLSGKRNCQCELCKKRKSEYNRAYERPSRKKK